MTLVQAKTCSLSVVRDAHHLADDLQRQRGGDPLDEVALAARGLASSMRSTTPVGLVARRSRSTLATSLGVKPLATSDAQPEVLGVVHVDHRAEELVHLDGQVADVEPPPEQNSCGLRLAANTSSWRVSAQ